MTEMEASIFASSFGEWWWLVYLIVGIGAFWDHLRPAAWWWLGFGLSVILYEIAIHPKEVTQAVRGAMGIFG